MSDAPRRVLSRFSGSPISARRKGSLRTKRPVGPGVALNSRPNVLRSRPQLRSGQCLSPAHSRRALASEQSEGAFRPTLTHLDRTRPFAALALILLIWLGASVEHILAHSGNVRSAGKAAQASDWTVLFTDDFESGTSFNWLVQGADGPAGRWTVERDGSNTVFSGQGHSLVSLAEGRWADYRFKAKVKLIRGGIHLNYRLSSCARYFIGFNSGEIYLSRTICSGTQATLVRLGTPHDLDRWYALEIVGLGSNVRVYVDGQLTIDHTDAMPVGFGTIGFEAVNDSHVHIDDVEVTGPSLARATSVWVKTGGPLGGMGYDVRMRADNPDTMLVTDTQSGVSISTNGGRAWRASNKGIMTRSGPSGDAIPVFCLTIDPHDPDEPYRVCRRAHSERGWVLWDDQRGTHRRFENVRSGWSESMARSTRRNGRRWKPLPRSWAARAKHCAAGCGRPSGTPASGRA